MGATPRAARLLTMPQEEALRAAVDCGYYLIPRPINLRQLAERLRVSSAALSERLRRAEGRVVTRYVTEGGRSPWDDRTLFDGRPIETDDAAWTAAVEAQLGEMPRR